MFRCGDCRRSYCGECRAPGESELCVRCEMAADVKGADSEKLAIPRHDVAAAQRRNRFRLLVGVLVLLDLGIAAGAFLLTRQEGASDLAPAFDAVDAVSRAVESRRDSGGKVPASLDGIPLPTGAAEKVRRGEIRYLPSADRSSFSVVHLFQPGAPATDPDGAEGI